MNGDRRKGRSATPPVSRLTAVEFGRIIAPRRRYLWWFAAAAVSWLGVFLFAYAEDRSRAPFPVWAQWAKLLAYLGTYLVSLSPLATLPGTVFADLRANRLEPVLLTAADRRAVARAYHLRAFGFAALLLAVVAPVQIASGQGFEPLMWVGEVGDHGWHSLLRHTTHGASGLLALFGLAYLAAALALVASVWLRSRAWALLPAAAGVALYGAVAWGCAHLWLGFFRDVAGTRGAEDACGCGVGGVIEPGFTLLLWSFAAVCALAALALGELALRLAARRLDRLVTD